MTLQRGAEAKDLRNPVRVAAAVLAATQVHMVGVEPCEPFALVASGQVQGRRLGDRQEMPAVRRCHSGLIGASHAEPLGGELADGLRCRYRRAHPANSGTITLLSTSEPSRPATWNSPMPRSRRLNRPGASGGSGLAGAIQTASAAPG